MWHQFKECAFLSQTIIHALHEAKKMLATFPPSMDLEDEGSAEEMIEFDSIRKKQKQLPEEDDKNNMGP